MKISKKIFLLILIGCTLLSLDFRAAETASTQKLEYLTLRWAGRENTHVIRPSGEVEFIGRQLIATKKPDRADDRSFYMNLAMNALARDGWELVAITSDDYVFKRAAK